MFDLLAAAMAVSEQNIVAEACPTSRVSHQLPIEKNKSTNQRYTSYRTAVGAWIGSARHGARRCVSVEGVAPGKTQLNQKLQKTTYHSLQHMHG